MNIYIIGGGPSGMMAAISAKKYHKAANVFLIDKNATLGRKMRYTGGGRCNVTASVNAETVIANTPKNGRFLYSALSNFNPQNIIEFFEENGCELKEEDHHRMFPISNQSSDIINTLEKVLRNLGVALIFNEDVYDIDINKKIIITNHNKYRYDKIILACGGKTLPQSGSDGFGYELAKRFGHTITDLVPAEVPLVSNDELIQDKSLQGLSFKDVNLKVLDGKKVKSNLTHDLLFAHFGLSGPVALRSSFEVQKLIEKGPVTLLIDFFPGLNELDETHFNHQKRLIDKVRELDGDLLYNLKNFKMTVYNTRGFKYAFVTSGGVKLKEIDPKTMKSKLKDELSFAGELMDVSSFTGGYNITSALVTGYTAGKFVLPFDN